MISWYWELLYCCGLGTVLPSLVPPLQLSKPLTLSRSPAFPFHTVVGWRGTKMGGTKVKVTGWEKFTGNSNESRTQRVTATILMTECTRKETIHTEPQPPHPSPIPNRQYQIDPSVTFTLDWKEPFPTQGTFPSHSWQWH